ncbi:hypothetical protein B0F90DRAFT_1666253 [Multifurca ochricompacta]|uniref:Uncharacterized protein n=1 Tax=Multifurca ochricompacta TaxID=376703 RepID=A0AAD4QNT2_9AGAM|nr:hypothetical protein B0F90DRAFT_1666253 [Multifurca ochricompacta]
MSVVQAVNSRIIVIVPSDQGIHNSLPGSSRRRSRQGSSACEVHDLVGLANCFDNMVRRIVGVGIASSSGVFDDGPEASSLRQGVRPSQGLPRLRKQSSSIRQSRRSVIVNVAMIVIVDKARGVYDLSAAAWSRYCYTRPRCSGSSQVVKLQSFCVLLFLLKCEAGKIFVAAFVMSSTSWGGVEVAAGNVEPEWRSCVDVSCVQACLQASKDGRAFKVEPGRAAIFTAAKHIPFKAGSSPGPGTYHSSINAFLARSSSTETVMDVVASILVMQELGCWYTRLRVQRGMDFTTRAFGSFMARATESSILLKSVTQWFPLGGGVSSEAIKQLSGAATVPCPVQSLGVGFEAFVRNNRNTTGGRLDLVTTAFAMKRLSIQSGRDREAVVVN